MDMLSSGDEVRITEGRFTGKEGAVLLPLHSGAEVVIDGQRHWFHREEMQLVVTV